jgi:hypothetical protein
MRILDDLIVVGEGSSKLLPGDNYTSPSTHKKPTKKIE